MNVDLVQFVQLAEYALTTVANRDLVRLDKLADMIYSYQQSAERTYLLLTALPRFLSGEARSVVLDSSGYQTILRWGASRYLKDFWYRLQQRFRVSRIAIKNEAAQNLARELGETETQLMAQFDVARARIAELETMVAALRQEAYEQAVANMAQTLQDQPNPALDEIYAQYQWLRKEGDAGTGLPLEQLRVLITLENVLEGLHAIGIRAFPGQLGQPFVVHSSQLGEFTYVEGSPFGDEKTKTVICIRPGWRVGEQVITPARVKAVGEE